MAPPTTKMELLRGALAAHPAPETHHTSRAEPNLRSKGGSASDHWHDSTILTRQSCPRALEGAGGGGAGLPQPAIQLGRRGGVRLSAGSVSATVPGGGGAEEPLGGA